MADFIKRCAILLAIGWSLSLLVVCATWAVSHQKPRGLSPHDEVFQSLIDTKTTLLSHQYDTGAGNMLVYWTEETNGEISAYIFDVCGKGYNSPLRCLVKVDPNGRVQGIGCLAQQEGVGYGYIASLPAVLPLLTMWKSISIVNPIIVETRMGGYENCEASMVSALLHSNSVAAISGATKTTQGIASMLSTTVASCFYKVKGLPL